MIIKKEGEITFVWIDPRLDTITSKEAEKNLMEVVESGSKKIVCDFSNTSYISSAGLRVMLSTVKKLQKNGGKMVLSCMNSFVQGVFKMAGFTDVFEIHETQEQATASLMGVSR